MSENWLHDDPRIVGAKRIAELTVENRQLESDNARLREELSIAQQQLAEAQSQHKRNEDATALLARMVEMEDTFGVGSCLFKPIIESGVVTNMMAFNPNDIRQSHIQPIIDAVYAAIEAAKGGETNGNA